MPTYEYECQSCSLKFEVRKGFNDTSKVKCPQCQCETRRVFLPVPIIFKGPGFYVTDTAREKNKGKANGETKAEVKSDVPKESKGEKVS